MPRILPKDMTPFQRILTLGSSLMAANFPDFISVAIYLVMRRKISLDSDQGDQGEEQKEDPYGDIYVGEESNSNSIGSSSNVIELSSTSGNNAGDRQGTESSSPAPAPAPNAKEVRCIMFALRTYAATAFLDVALLLSISAISDSQYKLITMR